jgi:hypothetical protein
MSSTKDVKICWFISELVSILILNCEITACTDNDEE